MRLIDADALKAFIDDCEICGICPHKKMYCSYECDFPDFVTEKWAIAIDAQPTVDAVEVVRCEECRHLTADGRCLEFADDCLRPSSSDYCSYGERKDNVSL